MIRCQNYSARQALFLIAEKQSVLVKRLVGLHCSVRFAAETQHNYWNLPLIEPLYDKTVTMQFVYSLAG